MLKGTTRTGFKYSVNEEIMTKSYRWTKTVARYNKGTESEKLLIFDSLLSMLLSEEDQERLFEHLDSNVEGGATNINVIAEFNDIVESVSERVQGKNS